MRLAFEGLSATVEVPDAPDLLAALEAGAADWPFRRAVSDEDPAARIEAAGDAFLVHFPGEEPVPASAVGAACALMVSIAEQLVVENPDRLCFHGGAALFSGRLVIFPGRSHAGKSTMIARLAAGGHTVFGDDILPLDAEGNGLALGVAPRLRLPLPARASPAFRSFVADHAGASDGRYHYLALPEGQLASRGTTAPLGAIVLLDRHAEGPAELREAPDSLTLKLLARQTVMSTQDTRPLLAQMHAIVRRLPCLVLTYSDLEDAAALLETAFASWPPAHGAPPVSSPDELAKRLLERDEPAGGEGKGQTRPAYRPGMKLVRNPAVSPQSLGGEAFLAGFGETAAIHHLNPVGTAIWNLLSLPTDEHEAAQALSMAFPQADPGMIGNDVAALFADLYDAGLAVDAASQPLPGA